MPKGVMWRQEDMFMAGMGGGPPGRCAVRDARGGRRRTPWPAGWCSFPAAPLMHGAAELSSFISFFSGAKILLIRKFSGHGALELIAEQKANMLMVVGDAMATPILEALQEKEYDLSSLMVLSSAGALLSQTTRERFTSIVPNLYINDSFGSTETGYNGSAKPGTNVKDGLKFAVNARTAVFGDDDQPVEPGSGKVGIVGQKGHIPLGYYNDPEKTAKTFRVIDGDPLGLPR